jgi:hypothetical protein
MTKKKTSPKTKKAVSKKITSKKINRKTSKTKKKSSMTLTKKKKSNIKQIEEIDDLFSIINTVQVDKAMISILISNNELLPIIRNLINDADIEYKERIMKRSCIIKLYPPKDNDNIDLHVQELDDEFLEEGQLF